MFSILLKTLKLEQAYMQEKMVENSFPDVCLQLKLCVSVHFSFPSKPIPKILSLSSPLSPLKMMMAAPPRIEQFSGRKIPLHSNFWVRSSLIDHNRRMKIYIELKIILSSHRSSLRSCPMMFLLMIFSVISYYLQSLIHPTLFICPYFFHMYRDSIPIQWIYF